VRNGSMRSSPLAPLAAAFCLSLWWVAPAQAQAWLPPKGEASVTIGISRDFANQHTDDDGNNLTLPTGEGWGSMTWNDIRPILGYGITDRLAVSGYATLHSVRDMNVAGIALSMTYGFSLAQVIKRSKGTQNPPGHPASPS
jgi:hypothetical protein